MPETFHLKQTAGLLHICHLAFKESNKVEFLACKLCVWAQALLAQMFAAVYLATLIYNPGKQAQIVSDDVGDVGKDFI